MSTGLSSYAQLRGETAFHNVLGFDYGYNVLLLKGTDLINIQEKKSGDICDVVQRCLSTATDLGRCSAKGVRVCSGYKYLQERGVVLVNQWTVPVSGSTSIPR